MKVVGVKVLKNKLSSYLKLVRDGEVVLVSDRNEVIAEIRRPTRACYSGLTRFEAFVEDAVMRGALQRPSAAAVFPAGRSDLTPPPVPLDALELLADSRAERT